MFVNFLFDNLWLVGDPLVPWKPPTKVNDSKAASGKEQDGVHVSSDATKLSHYMC